MQEFGGTNEGFSRQEQCHDVDLAFLREELRRATKKKITMRKENIFEFGMLQRTSKSIYRLRNNG